MTRLFGQHEWGKPEIWRRAPAPRYELRTQVPHNCHWKQHHKPDRQDHAHNDTKRDKRLPAAVGSAFSFPLRERGHDDVRLTHTKQRTRWGACSGWLRVCLTARRRAAKESRKTERLWQLALSGARRGAARSGAKISGRRTPGWVMQASSAKEGTACTQPDSTPAIARAGFI